MTKSRVILYKEHHLYLIKMTDPERKRYAILLVEDDSYIGENTKEVLEEFGHRVLLYQKGSEVLTDLDDEMVYSIAIVDHYLYEEYVSGIEVIAALKKKYPERPIICSSGATYGISEADATIRKPYNLNDLDPLIQQLMQRKS